MIILDEVGLSFDDVLLIPEYSTITSRFSGEVDLSTNLFPLHPSFPTLKFPIVSANMDRVTEDKLACEMHKLGGLGIIHRFLPISRHKELLQQLDFEKAIGCIGIGKEGRKRARALCSSCVAFLIDIAHGHCKEMLKQIEWLKKEFGYPIIAGNIATRSAAIDLINAGADCLKVGVGCGSLCSTRIHTGCGIPQLTAILDVKDAIMQVNRPVTLIADGGIRNSGDIIKALAAGANAVMIGNLFAGTDEAPGTIHRDRRTGQLFKIYRGLASEEAQLEWKGFTSSIEGESMKVPYKGPVEQILNALILGMLSGMSYLNALNLAELGRVVAIKQTSAGYRESIPHGLEKSYG